MVVSSYNPQMGRVSVNNPQSSIAVLAFEDMSPDRDQGYFCDGLAEEIINALARVEGLRVASRTSSFAYKDKPEDIRVVGQKLRVESVLEGSVRKTDDRLRITTQLVNAADGYHIWSKSYDRKVQDVFAIQLEIAQSIAGALEVELSDDEKYAIGASGGGPSTTNLKKAIEQNAFIKPRPIDSRIGLWGFIDPFVL